MRIKILSRITYSVPLFSLILSLNSCSSPSKPQVHVDVCKKVMTSVGRYADLALKLIDEPEKAIAEYSKTSSELSVFAASLPSGPQRDYVETLAEDFKNMTNADAGMEAALTFSADIRPEKLRIVCPNS